MSPVQCKICQKSLAAKQHEHMRVVHGPEYQYECPVCDVSNFDHVKELITHYRVSHWKEEPLCCNQCPEVLFSPKDLQHHILSHSSVSKIFCKLHGCGFRFVSKEACQKHQERDHIFAGPEVTRPQISWTCELCGLNFSCTEGKLKYAMKGHHNSAHAERQFKCKCGKTFSQAIGLRSHVERCMLPAAVRRYICVYKNCNKSFKTQQDLNSHSQYHKPAKYPCEKCGRQFYHRKYLTEHKCSFGKEET